VFGERCIAVCLPFISLINSRWRMGILPRLRRRWRLHRRVPYIDRTIALRMNREEGRRGCSCILGSRTAWTLFTGRHAQINS